MKKLAIYSALFVTLLALTSCENRTTNSSNPPSRDRTITPQNPNQPNSNTNLPGADRDQIQR